MKRIKLTTLQCKIFKALILKGKFAREEGGGAEPF